MPSGRTHSACAKVQILMVWSKFGGGMERVLGEWGEGVKC